MKMKESSGGTVSRKLAPDPKVCVVAVQSPSRVLLFIPVVKLINTRGCNWDK